MKEKFKLKHLDIILEDKKKDFATLMVDVLGYKNSIFGKAKFFVKNFLEMKKMLEDIEKVDFEKIPLNENSHIKKPSSINDIPYLAMLNLRGVVDNQSELSMANYIAKIIAIATYSENRSSLYKPESKSFNNYVNNLMNVSLFDMVALYVHITNDLKNTSKEWDERFMSVEIKDSYLENAGGEGLAQFNVVNTIKGLCNEFNVTHEEAMYISYSLVMTSAYSKAYSGYVQENIRIKKEAEYNAKQK
tara:strand:+ start:323 stop:1060 length:738 start_codon:yes stop_codon:yes gene_type:complete